MADSQSPLQNTLKTNLPTDPTSQPPPMQPETMPSPVPIINQPPNTTIVPPATNAPPEAFVDEFKNRDKSWIHPHLPIDLPNNLKDVHQILSTPDLHRNSVFNFPPFQLGEAHKRFPDTYYLTKDDKDIGELEYSLNYKEPGESKLPVNFQHPSLDLDYAFMDVKPHARGENVMAQQSTRFEDLLRHATDHLDPKVKKNITSSLLASLDVGKYYHATQGYRYQTNKDRAKHLQSLIDTIDFSTQPPEEIPPDVREIPRDAQGNYMSLHDLGYTPEDLEKVKDFLEHHKQIAESKNDKDIENQIEPWNILSHQPHNDSPIFYKTEENDLIKIPLMKYLLLTGGAWSGFKRIHPFTAKDHEGHTFAELMRAHQMKRAENKGKRWEWIKKKMEKSQKSGYNIIIRKSLKNPIKDTSSTQIIPPAEPPKKGLRIPHEDLLSYDELMGFMNKYRHLFTHK